MKSSDDLKKKEGKPQISQDESIKRLQLREQANQLIHDLQISLKKIGQEIDNIDEVKQKLESIKDTEELRERIKNYKELKEEIDAFIIKEIKDKLIEEKSQGVALPEELMHRLKLRENANQVLLDLAARWEKIGKRIENINALREEIVTKNPKELASFIQQCEFLISEIDKLIKSEHQEKANKNEKKAGQSLWVSPSPTKNKEEKSKPKIPPTLGQKR